MKIFITGSNGFIGRHVVKKALQLGHEVIGLQFSKPKFNEEDVNGLKWVRGSLEDDLSSVLAGCDVLIHLAAYGVDPQSDSWTEAFRWNVNASLKMYRDAHQSNIKRTIFIGSCSEYGKSAERYEYIPIDAPLEPVNSYGASKAAATVAAMAYARENELELVVLRPFHVYGEGEGANRFWPSLMRAALNGKDFQMTIGDQVRDFTPVDFVAEKIIEYSLNQNIKPGEPVIRNIGTGRPATLKEFAQENWGKFNAKGKLKIGAIRLRDNEVMRYVPKI